MTKTAVAGIVSVSFLATVIILGMIVFGIDDSVTPFVTTVFGFIGLAITQLVTSSKAESAETKVTELSADLRNGTFKRLVREALEDIANDPTNSLRIDDTQERRENDGGSSL